MNILGFKKTATEFLKKTLKNLKEIQRVLEEAHETMIEQDSQIKVLQNELQESKIIIEAFIENTDGIEEEFPFVKQKDLSLHERFISKRSLQSIEEGTQDIKEGRVVPFNLDKSKLN